MSRLVPLVVILLAPCVAGCPIPISHTETVSAPIVGTVRGPDDRPVRNVPVVVAMGSDCTEPALRDTTDAAGRFSLPAAKKTYHVYWVIPNFDRGIPAYSLCIGTSDTVLAAYAGLGSLRGDAPVDSITCVQWSWRNIPRAACSGNIERSLVIGGRWTDGEATGRYRIILTRQDSIPPDQRRGLLSRVWNGAPRSHRYFLVVVQWLEQPDPDGPATVRTVAELPLSKDVEWAGELALGEMYGRWCASVRITRLTHTLYWENHKSEDIAFTLGSPGQARRVPAS